MTLNHTSTQRHTGGNWPLVSKKKTSYYSILGHCLATPKLVRISVSFTRDQDMWRYSDLIYYHLFNQRETT